MKKVYNVDNIPSVKSISDYFNDLRKNLPTKIMDDLNNVLEGAESLDREVKLKTSEVQKTKQVLLQKEQLLVQKDKNLEKLKETGTVSDQKEFVDVLHKLYPNWYPERFEDWPADSWGKQVIDNGDYQVIKNNLPAYRQQVAEKEFIDILHELYPNWYPLNIIDWPTDSWGKEAVDRKDYKVMEDNLPIYKQWLANKKELVDILPKLHPESYPMKYEEWTNQYAKGLLDKGDYKTIEQSLPTYRKQLARKEFIEILPKLYSNDYPIGFENWTNQWGKGVVDKDEFETIKNSLPIYKKQLLKKEFIDIMHQVNPKDYPARFEDWSNKTWSKDIVEKENYKDMEQSLSIYRQKLKEMEKENVLAVKDLLLNDKKQEIAKLKEVLAIKEIETQNKDQLFLAKELENKELLTQKDKELQDKSLVKNEFINQVVESKDKEVLNAKIELLEKQLESKDEIIKKDQLISELKDNLLAALRSHKEGNPIYGAEDISLREHQVDETILGGNMDEIQVLSKYLSELIVNPDDKNEPFSFSNLLNFIPDINHINTSQSMALTGEILNIMDPSDITHSVYSNEDVSGGQG